MLLFNYDYCLYSLFLFLLTSLARNFCSIWNDFPILLQKSKVFFTTTTTTKKQMGNERLYWWCHARLTIEWYVVHGNAFHSLIPSLMRLELKPKALSKLKLNDNHYHHPTRSTWRQRIVGIVSFVVFMAIFECSFVIKYRLGY